MSQKELLNFESIRYFAARYPDLDFSAIEACVYLHRLTMELEAAFDAHFGRHDLSRGRFMILIMLMRQNGGGLAPAELAEACGVTRATVTGLLDNLEASELVTRTQKAGDRRGVEILLTPKGLARMEGLMPDHYQRITAMMALLSRDEQGQLVELLRKVRQGIPKVAVP